MSMKFGELMEQNPVMLAVFYADTPQLTVEGFSQQIRDLAARYHDVATVILFDMSKNEMLCNSLRVYHNPSAILFVNSEQVFKTDIKEIEQLDNLINLYKRDQTIT